MRLFFVFQPNVMNDGLQPFQNFKNRVKEFSIFSSEDLST